MLGRSNTALTMMVLLFAVVGFVTVLWLNSSPEVAPVVALPTRSSPTPQENPINRLLRQGFGQAVTPLPSAVIPSSLPPIPTSPQVVNADVESVDASTVEPPSDGTIPVAVAVTPTMPPSTLEVALNGAEVVGTRDPESWQPPALQPPLNRDPLGRDHYWFYRPLDANANNWILEIYPYGSDGPSKDNPRRIHHGVDMSNRVGERVRAAGSGTVIWASDGRLEDVDTFESPSYGNVIVVQHDFSFRGQSIYTLYAHLSAAFVQVGDFVEAGQVIGLVGATGQVTGPHLHFEVRLGENRYRATVNPALWIVPYVGHGVIAGRVSDANGNYPSILHDIDITVRRIRDRLTEATTTTYVLPGTASDVNADPAWQENFVVADVPVGLYEVIATINGQRIIERVEVLEGATAWVELQPSPRPTSTPSSEE